jgi:AraC-like DNA-binding protein
VKEPRDPPERPRPAAAPAARNDFPAIVHGDDDLFDRIRELYLYREPELLASIRLGDRPGATRIINLLLVHIYSVGAERSELLKGLLLELVVMMSRAAVEAGARQTEVLGLGFRHLAELAEIEDDEGLSRWLRESVLRIFEAAERRMPFETPPRIAKILDLIREHACSGITREELAKKAGVSAPHLSDLLRARTGHSFTELAREARIDAACELLRTTDLPVAEIAQRCGFCDQSYFSRVFADLKGTTPRRYREDPSARKTQNFPPGTQDPQRSDL